MHSLQNLFKNGFSNNWWFSYICVKWWCDALILTYHTMLNAICAAMHIKCILASKVQPKGECSVMSMKNQESQRYLFHGRIKVWFLNDNFSVDRKVFLCVCLSLRGQGNFVSRWSLKGIWIISLWASRMIYTF